MINPRGDINTTHMYLSKVVYVYREKWIETFMGRVKGL